VHLFFQGELMILDEERPKKKMDIFEIGIYAIEAGLVAAIVYAMIAFPMWLNTAAS
jgi:hypothetical protein